MPETKLPALRPADAIVMPAVTPDEAVKEWQAYQELKKKIIAPEDVRKIKDKDFLKKSYWRKISRFFNLIVEIINEYHEKEGEVTTYFCMARATAPNGTFQDGDGACSTNEKGLDKTPHNTRATAITRAKNRAISDLVGGGEVSADEIIADDPQTTPTVSGEKITEKQRKRLFAIMKAKARPERKVKAYLKRKYHLDHTKDIKKDWYEQIIYDIEHDLLDYGERPTERDELDTPEKEIS